MTTNVEASPTPAPSASVGKKATWAWTVATFFGAGLLKPGPGTWGSLAAAVECEHVGNVPVRPKDVIDKLDRFERFVKYQ